MITSTLISAPVTAGLLRAPVPVAAETAALAIRKGATVRDPTAPIVLNVCAGMNLTDAKAAWMVAASQVISQPLGAISLQAAVVTGPPLGLWMTMRNPGPHQTRSLCRFQSSWGRL